MSYQAPLDDMNFLLHSQSDPGSDPGPDRSEDGDDSVLLQQAARLAQQSWAACNASGDQQGCRLIKSEIRGQVQSEVQLADDIHQAFRRYANDGWMGLTMPQRWGGQQQSEVLGTLVGEMLTSSNHALSMLPALTMSACRALIAHASDALRDRYLPPIIAGQWTATMCMTEAHCGSDLGLVRSRAEPHAGGYRIYGSKIFISYGSHNASDNIIHLVLARLPEAPAGIKGLSLFLVPQKRPDAQGNWQQDNHVLCTGIEEKMGIHASPTCSLSFEGAHGDLVGREHDGIHAMFTMMNEMRLGTCLQGVGLSEHSYQKSLAYARQRLQMRSLSGVKNPQGDADAIIEHPDVRRMLLTQKAFADGGRALANFCAQLLDKQVADPNDKDAALLLELLTPIAKGFCTEAGLESASHAIQVYGGHGYIRDNGVEQLYRDGRIATLYEGTTGIQALDLLGRKVLGNQGTSLRLFTKKIHRLCQQHQQHPELAGLVSLLHPYAKQWPELSMTIGVRAMKNHDEAGAASVDFLMYSGYVTLGYFHLRAALQAWTLLQQSGSPFSDEFLQQKIQLAGFYLQRILPRSAGHHAAVQAPLSSLDQKF